MSATDRPWRSLDEIDGSGDSTAPSPLTEYGPPRIERRSLLKMMAATTAAAGLGACSRPEAILPYVDQPEMLVPGIPVTYATTLSSQGFGIGALVETHEGRPVKVEGNPDHPSSLGATDAVMQAAVWTLFDPDRSRTPVKRGATAPFADFLADAARLRAQMAADKGASAALLIEPTTSPTVLHQLSALRKTYPALRIFMHDTLATPGEGEATRHLFGRDLAVLPRFDRASRILSLDSDFLAEGAGRLAHARAFTANRRVRKQGDGMNRLYVLETTPTITGAAADHRLAMRPSHADAAAAAISSALSGEALPGDLPVDANFIRIMAEDMRAAGRDALVVAGSHQSAHVHAAALAANMALGSLGHTVELIERPGAFRFDGDLADLCEAIREKQIRSVLALAHDPVATAPVDADAAGAFSGLDLLIHWGLYRNNTAVLADWHIPAAHDLESWGDLRGHDGTASLQQPMIRPLFGGKTLPEMLAVLSPEPAGDARALVRETWQALDDDEWQHALKRGVLEGSAATPADVRPAGRRPETLRRDRRTSGLDIRFVADPFLGDGRHANCAMLQELPNPVTRTVWGNGAFISPATASSLGISDGQAITISHDGRRLAAPALIVPGQPDSTVTLTLGHIRSSDQTVTRDARGHDAYPLRQAGSPWLATGAAIEPSDGEMDLVTTQHHQRMEGRDILRTATLADLREGRLPEPEPEPESLYPEWEYEQEAWGMSIDLTACIGCMACVSACQAENNIPAVGPEECAAGHEMHWLRIDRYYTGPPEAPGTHFQPVPCMHCEKAPCEVVCPVNATVHTHDGLNAQVYNRCIGTRYCSQNCPYKVRRFNFFDYQDFGEDADLRQAGRNPDVTVRSRGVMEKCTYCVQRISRARIDAKIDNRLIADGDVVTACQQACPAQAISFGNLNDPDARVVADKAAPHDYALLAHLGTRPRTTYLAEIKNPHPDLAKPQGEDTADG
ncbi:MAG: molybdopterin oxidoreductase [Phyllobacteriaceae bacterium]|nr:molybdopterin oxidoreductase [Phyllobacteriaceae bacterium]